ncbi:lipase [Paraburkholderia hospita]|uniref:Lipase n=2 Tax=Burkholderiaceae TaxID=119060 RepID=A0AAN1J9V5_9BURK|nr:lipase [Paraburkholderia hospita]AUT70139.1 lipase [Paraburkholderia hospita]SEH90084.1 Lipase (class 3) [Paraburkholderia hospita]
MTPHDFALLAQEAYDATPDIGIESSASRAIVRQTSAGLCVAFPGTDNVDCWGADLDLLPVLLPGVGRVHRGFHDAWQAIATPVMAAIGDQPVTLVGHSLGAASAILAAASLTLAGKPPVTVFGFEPPRVSPDLGIRTLLAAISVNLFKNGNDLVPDVPPGWIHAALLTHIGKPALPWPNVRDHSIARVIAALSDELYKPTAQY